MTSKKYDLLGIGNAMVDVLSHASDDFVKKQSKNHGMVKGAMSLIDENRAVELYADMGPAIEASGGSAANTMAGFASFGGNGAYIGKVADDQLGEVFRHDLTAQGVTYKTTPLALGAPTGRCLILVTPDGERTMNTFLGASIELKDADIDKQMIASAGIIYLEGYLFDPPLAKDAFRSASKIAHSHGNKVSLTLSDPFCVDRHREDFQALVDNHVDILFANEKEIKSLCETDSFEDAQDVIRNKCEIAVLTRSEKGSVIVTKEGQVITIDALPVDEVVDTTGAGDQYAAGFLYGYTQGMALKVCGQLGTMAATEVITHMGPRPETPYHELLETLAA